MDEVKWTNGGLWFEDDLVARLDREPIGWDVSMYQDGDYILVRNLTLPVAMQLVSAWCLAVTGQVLPEENAPWTV